MLIEILRERGYVIFEWQQPKRPKSYLLFPEDCIGDASKGQSWSRLEDVRTQIPTFTEIDRIGVAIIYKKIPGCALYVAHQRTPPYLGRVVHGQHQAKQIAALMNAKYETKVETKRE